MGDDAEKQQLIDEVFRQYDPLLSGELSAAHLQLIHADIRIEGMSLPQVQQSIKYVCTGDTCEKSEFLDTLQEMDRRYFLVQDFKWEFSLLDRFSTNAITEDQAKWFMKTVHGKYFCEKKWERFCDGRLVPGSGVNFPEIEVILCDIPSREEWRIDQRAQQKELEVKEKEQKALGKKMEEEKEKKRREREEQLKREENVLKKRKLEEDRRRKAQEEERQKRLKEKEKAAELKRKLEDEEERGRREAEERERQKKAQEEREKREQEEKELERLQQLEEKAKLEEEELRRKEQREANDIEALLRETTRKEKETEEEAKKHLIRQKEAGDDKSKEDAAQSEAEARLRQKEYRNKAIRYRLKAAIKRRHREKLPGAISQFKKAKLPDDDLDLPKAERLLKEFQARDGLEKAMTSRQLPELERAIHFVKHNGFELQMERELIQANKVLLQLRRLERIRAEILELKQATVAEIRSYQNPPPCVHVVMTGTFLLLGHKQKETKIWKNVQALVGKTGKDGLKRRCLGCNPAEIPVDSAAQSKKLLSQYELDEVRDVSAGAATFYLWSCTMIEENEAHVVAVKREEEEKQRKLKEKRRKQKEKEERRAQGIEDADEEDEEEHELETNKSQIQSPSSSSKGAPKKPQDDRSRSRSVGPKPGVKGQNVQRSKSTGSSSIQRNQKTFQATVTQKLSTPVKKG